jgi:formate dehydrogenase subunit delta
MSTAERTVRMANQIARNIAAQHPPDPAQATAAHIRAFWDGRMRALILAHLDAGGEGLDPLARKAVALLARQHPHKAPSGPADASAAGRG